MKVVVTGGAGFIGSHLTRSLSAQGHDVLVLDNLKRAQAEIAAEVSDLPGVRLVEGDIRDRQTVDEVVTGAAVVYHLAAQSNVLGAAADVEYSVTTNVLGTANVLASALKASVGRVVFASSREAYGEARYLPVDEGHPTAPKNLYGASKVAGEAYCRAFAAPGFQVSILRLANVYGVGDRDRVIPLFAEAARAGRALTVYGGDQILDFVWVGTVVDALELAAEGAFEGEVNIGTGRGTSIEELAEHVVSEAGSSSMVDRRPPRPIEVTRFVADVSRMRAGGLEPEPEPLGHLREVIAGAQFDAVSRG